jgi:hypothetical protein
MIKLSAAGEQGWLSGRVCNDPMSCLLGCGNRVPKCTSCSRRCLSASRDEDTLGQVPGRAAARLNTYKQHATRRTQSRRAVLFATEHEFRAEPPHLLYQPHLYSELDEPPIASERAALNEQRRPCFEPTDQKIHGAF